MPRDNQADGAVAASGDAPEEHSTLTLLGQSVGSATLVSVTYTSLLMCMGWLGEEGEGSEVLVPFVEMKFDGTDVEGGSAAPELFAQILTLEDRKSVV